jgi:hypothetical protein
LANTKLPFGRYPGDLKHRNLGFVVREPASQNQNSSRICSLIACNGLWVLMRV